MILKSTTELQPWIDAVLAEVLPRLQGLSPKLEVQHVGATSIPGALTKGDVDLVVRVEASEFPAMKEALSGFLAVRQPENWTPAFASFGDEVRYALPLGVQLVVRDSALDIFVFLREVLLSNPDQLEAYNQLKIGHANAGETAYWTAKHLFFERLLQHRTDS